MHRKAAFTLAEVLITLTIIGVVAAITLPTVINNYKKHVTVQRLKTAYSIFSQAFEASKLENGDVITWDSSLSNIELAEKYLLPYLKNPRQVKKNLKPHFMYSLYGNQSMPFLFAGGGGGFDLDNGMSFIVSNQLDAGNQGYAIWITVDINGNSKGPNILGYDGFVFVIPKLQSYNYKRANQLLPAGFGWTDQQLADTAGVCSKQGSWAYYAGYTCAAVIMKNNWKIPDNYPW